LRLYTEAETPKTAAALLRDGLAVLKAGLNRDVGFP